MNQLKWGVLLSYSSMGLGVLISIAYTPFMLRLLGQSEWGLYSLTASVVNYLYLLSFGFGAAYMRYYARAAISSDSDEVARLNGLFLLVFSSMAALTIIAGAVLLMNAPLVLGDKLTPAELSTARLLIVVMTFTVAVSFPANVFNSFITANERFLFQQLLAVARVVSTPLLTLWVLLVGYRSAGMAAVTATVVVAVTAVSIWYCLRRLEMRFSFRQMDISLLGEIAVFSSYIFLNMVIDQVNWSVDKLILGRVGGTVAVAVYALAAQLNSYYLSLSTAVSSVFVPKVNRMVASPEEDQDLTHLFTRVGRLQFLVLALVCGGLVIFGRPFLRLWAGEEYVGAYWIALLLVIPVTIPLIQSIGIEIQRAKNLHKFRSWLYLCIAALNVAVSIPLAQLYGGVGAAMGTGGALLIGNGLIMNIYYHKRVGIDMKHFWNAMGGFVPSLVVVGVAGAGILHFANTSSVSGILSWGVTYVFVYGLAMWFIGMDDYERDLIKRPVMRVARQSKRFAN